MPACVPYKTSAAVEALTRNKHKHRNRRIGRGHGALCAIQHLGVVASQAAPEGESA